jgi:hypothetical protein
MGARNLLNLALVALVIILGLLAYFKPGLQSEPAPRPLTTVVAPDQVSTIHIERNTRDPLTFVKREAHWYLVYGKQELPASGFQLQALLRLLEATSTSHYAADTVDLEVLGLEPPQVTLKIDDLEILLGNTEALGNRRYALIDTTVHLVEDRYQHLINAGWTNFVERRLVPAGSIIQTLLLPDMSLRLTNANQWQLSPEKPGVSADSIAQLIDHWNNASALFVRRYDGSQSDETIILGFRDIPETLTFTVTAHTPELILARPDWNIQYHLSGSMEASLLTLQQAPAQQ